MDISPFIHHNIIIADALAVPTASYGHSSGPILITRVECSGNEKSILECEHDLHTPYCSHSEDAGVRCTGMLYIIYMSYHYTYVSQYVIS